MEQNGAYNTESKFTGGAFANFFIELLSLLVGIVTLGLAYPAMTCWKLRWKAKHTYINGKRLSFNGTGMQLFGSYLLWLLLSLVTFGVYAVLAMPLNMKRWETKHTHFEGAQGESKFDGSIWGLFGVNFVANFVTVITFSFGSYWAHCYRQRWYCKHQIIDGCRMAFDGTGLQYFGKCIVWTLLTIVTIGVYSFWLVVNQEKWTVSHTRVEDPALLPEYDLEIAQAALAKTIKQKKPKDPPTERSIMGFIYSIVGTVLFWYNLLHAWAVYPIVLLPYIDDHLFMNYILLFSPAVILMGKVFSAVSLKKTKKRGLAIVGLIIGSLTLLLLLLMIIGSLIGLISMAVQ